MSTAQSAAPVCQSCGMPLEKSDDFGTEADGSQSKEYCTHCFQGGSFTHPDITMQQLSEYGTDTSILAGLKRWRDS